MDQSWEKWLSDLEMDESDFLDEFIGDNPWQSAFPCERHHSQPNFNAESTSVPTINTSPTSCILSFKDSMAPPVPEMTNESNRDQESAIEASPLCCGHQEELNYNEERDNKKYKRARSNSKTPDHRVAERKRRENLNKNFIALSSTIPGLKKMDKASILSTAINYVKQLEQRVRELEESKKTSVESVTCSYKSDLVATDDPLYCNNSDDRHCGPKTELPDIDVSISAKDVVLRIQCEKQKGIVVKILAELEDHNLSMAGISVLPYGNSSLNINIVAQMDNESNTKGNDLVKWLKLSLSKLMTCNNDTHNVN